MKKHLVPVVFIILAITVAILPLLPKSEAEEEFTYVDGMNYRLSFADEDILYIYGSDGIIAELPAEGLEGYTLDFSLKRDSAMVIPDMSYSIGGTLYYVDEDGATMVAEGVYYALASDGKHGVYISALEDERRYGQLFYYDGNESRCIEPRIRTRLENSRYVDLEVAISPDGKTVAYSRADEDGGITGMLYHKGKYIELGADIFPIAVSDNGKYLYYGRITQCAEELTAETERAPVQYYVRSNGEDHLICETKYYISFFVNRDFSEAITYFYDYISDKNTGVISTDGGRVIKTFKDFCPVGIISPQAGLAVSRTEGELPMFFKSCVRFGVDSFKDKVFHGTWGGQAHDFCVGAICPYHNTAYLGEDLQMHILTDSTHNMQCAEEGYAALYMKDDMLCLIPDIRSYSNENELLISQYCKSFGGNADFSTIYYVNTSNDLYSYQNGQRILLAEDVVLMNPGGVPAAAQFNGSIFFRSKEDGSVWRISPEGNVERREDIPNGASLRSFGCELLVEVYTDDGSDFYRFEEEHAVKIISGMKPYRR